MSAHAERTRATSQDHPSVRDSVRGRSSTSRAGWRQPAVRMPMHRMRYEGPLARQLGAGQDNMPCMCADGHDKPARPGGRDCCAPCSVQESDTGRICLICSEWKSWEKFSADPRRTRGKTSNCVDCAYWRTIKAIYGITREEWDWLHAIQNGKCALCGEPDTVRLNIDHDHVCHPTGRACRKCIRGKLCRVCNRMLGHIEAKPALRARFADYLDKRPLLTRTTEQMKSKVRPVAYEFTSRSGLTSICAGKGSFQVPLSDCR
jgi:hypothetical protein